MSADTTATVAAAAAAEAAAVVGTVPFCTGPATSAVAFSTTPLPRRLSSSVTLRTASTTIAEPCSVRDSAKRHRGCPAPRAVVAAAAVASKVLLTHWLAFVVLAQPPGATGPPAGDEIAVASTTPPLHAAATAALSHTALMSGWARPPEGPPHTAACSTCSAAALWAAACANSCVRLRNTAEAGASAWALSVRRSCARAPCSARAASCAVAACHSPVALLPPLRSPFSRGSSACLHERLKSSSEEGEAASRGGGEALSTCCAEWRSSWDCTAAAKAVPAASSSAVAAKMPTDWLTAASVAPTAASSCCCCGGGGWLLSGRPSRRRPGAAPGNVATTSSMPQSPPSQPHAGLPHLASHMRSPSQLSGQPTAHCTSSTAAAAPPVPPPLYAPPAPLAPWRVEEERYPAAGALRFRVALPTQSPRSIPQRVVLHAASQKPSPSHASMQPGAHLGTSHDRYTFCPRARVKKSSGHTSEPRSTSSLKYTKRRDSPGMRCRCTSMAGELKTGRCDALVKICACVTTVTRGCATSSHAGTCPLVTSTMRRSQGAYFSSERIE